MGHSNLHVWTFSKTLSMQHYNPLTQNVTAIKCTCNKKPLLHYIFLSFSRKYEYHTLMLNPSGF